MYAKYQEYVKKEKHITTAKKIMGYYNYYGRNYTVENVLLDMFVEKYGNNSWEPGTCILMDFPYEMQRKIIYDYICRDKGEPSVDQYEVCKLVYNLWQRIESDEELDDCYDFYILGGLKNFKVFDEEELRSIAYNDYKCVSSAYYYGYFILGFIPLLGNKEPDILDIVYKMNYDDGQDLLMFGLYQYKPSDFYNKLKEILIYWKKTGNIRFAQGTGIISQLWDIILKYKKAGYNLLEDPDLPFLKKIYKDENNEDKNISDYKKESKYSWIDYELKAIEERRGLDPDKFV